MNYNLTSKQPIFEQIIEQIKEYIESGVYAENEKLPSVRELAAQLNINPNTVARAYSMLEDEKLIYSLNKKGYYVVPEVERKHTHGGVCGNGTDDEQKSRHEKQLEKARESIKKSIAEGVTVEEMQKILMEFMEAKND